MEFIKRNIQRNYKRNKDVAFGLSSGSSTSVNNGSASYLGDKLDKSVWDENFYVDENGNLHSKRNFASDLGLTAYAKGYRDIATIMDGVITDDKTITKTDGRLTVIGGTGGGVSNWDDLEGKPSWIGDIKPTYSWDEITSKPSTFTPSSHTHSIDNIDNLQKTLDAKANSSHTHNYTSTVKVGSTSYNVSNNVISLPAYPTIPSSIKNPNALTISLNGTSQGAYDGSAAKSINITASSVGAAASSHTHNISNIANLQSSLDSKLNSSSYTANDVLSKIKSVDGSGSGLDADLLDGKNYSDIVNGNVASATKLQTARTIWGQSFNGTANVSGTLSSVSDISMSGRISSSYNSSTWINSLKNAVINCNISSYGGWINGKTKDGRIVISSYPSSNNNLYFGYAAQSKINAGTDNSFTHQMYWAGDSGQLTVEGNILSTGGITCYASDKRAKNIVDEISLSLKNIANSPIVRFRWNNWNIKDDGKNHIGGIAQYVQNILPEAVLDANGILNMDYATTAYIYSVQIARNLVKAEDEIDKLKDKIEKLENKLKLLGYEEVSTLVN